MKIVRIIPMLDFGGVEKRIKHSVYGFNHFSEYSLKIIVLGGEGKISKDLQVCKTLPVHLHHNIKIPNIWLILKLYRLLKVMQPSVVHTSAAEANFHGLIAAKMAGVPIRIGEEIGFPNHDWKWRIVFKLVYKSATKVIAISQAVKNKIVEFGEVEQEKVEVVYNPVNIGGAENGERTNEDTLQDIREWQRSQELKGGFLSGQIKLEYGENEKPFVFVTTCRLVRVKNLDALLEVFAGIVAEYQDKKLKLWIVGDGPERKNLEAAVDKLEIHENVVFWGFQDCVVPFLKKADAFVLPSFSEGFSISLVEAMLCGLPCIVTNQGGPSEIVDHERTGFLINPKNPADLRKKMNEVVVMSEEERGLMGKNAKQAGSKFSVDNYVNSLLKVYCTL